MADKNFKVKNGLTIEGGATDTTITADGAGSILVGGSALNFAPANLSINAQTDTSYTAVLADKDRLVEINNASANTFTVPLDSSVNFPVGAQINVLQTGAGQTTIAATNELGNWTDLLPPFALQSAVYGNGLFVITDGFATLTSTNGVIWTTSAGGGLGNSTTRDIGYGNNLFVIVGESGGLKRSTDLITWTTTTSGSSLEIQSVAYGNGIWVHVGGGAVASAQIRYSIDNAATWATATPNAGNFVLNTVAYGNGIWMAGGQQGTIRTSTDAITWTTRTSTLGTDDVREVFYGNGVWIAVSSNSSNNMSRSLDNGVTWVTTSSALPSVALETVAFDNGRWVAGGQNIASGSGFVTTSIDGATWTSYATSWYGIINGIAFGNGLVLAGGDQNDAKTAPHTFNTLSSTPGSKLRNQWSAATLIKRAANTWLATGDLSA